jgi:carboxylesterase type B
MIYDVTGFLQTSPTSGNFAINDIVASLNWIRENAGAFGADPNRVTLLGHRTGAVLANFLMLAPVATGKSPITSLSPLFPLHSMSTFSIVTSIPL